jgi:hypothetical protein
MTRKLSIKVPGAAPMARLAVMLGAAAAVSLAGFAGAANADTPIRVNADAMYGHPAAVLHGSPLPAGNCKQFQVADVRGKVSDTCGGVLASVEPW